jgi:tetratricopeptide (TPR) repeat protein
MRTPPLRLIATVVLAGVVLSSAASPASAREWLRVETPNFVVFGEPSAGRLREIADEFERFREGLARVVPGAAEREPVPTIVVVFNSQRNFEPYRPRYNGKPITLSGFFVSSSDENIVALAVDERTQALRTIFHEYAHIVITSIARELPIWLNEGLAEYYSTFALQDDGRAAIVGLAPVEHVLRLRQESLIPHGELLNVQASSPMYNEGRRRNVFYAQSWALVHMLTWGQPVRSKQLSRYIAETSAGTPADVAWKQIFGDFDVKAELRRYVNRDQLKAYRIRFDDDIASVQGSVSKPSEAEVEAALANLLHHVDAEDEAERRLEKAVLLTPHSGNARALLGAMRVRQGRPQVAERLLFEALADRSDWLVQYRAASGLVSLIDHVTEDKHSRIAETVREALDRVLAARPAMANAFALRGTLAVESRSDLDAGLQAIQRARSLAPGREDYAFEEARLRVERSEYDDARQILKALMTPRFHTDVRANARKLLEQVDDIATKQQAVYRKVRDGETRTEGRLERIDCSGPGVSFHVLTHDRLFRFWAPDITQVEFITLREDLLGPITCGRRESPENVYVTWRRHDASDGRVVAIEFLAR